MQCVRCKKYFEHDYEYFDHAKTQEHEENKTKELDPEEEALVNKYN